MRDWYVIKVIDDTTNQLVGQLLWGFVLEDNSNRFDCGDYVCTSAIEAINDDIITTAKSSKYTVVGAGKEFEADMTEVDLLRKGYSPVQVARLR